MITLLAGHGALCFLSPIEAVVLRPGEPRFRGLDFFHLSPWIFFSLVTSRDVRAETRRSYPYASSDRRPGALDLVFS